MKHHDSNKTKNPIVVRKPGNDLGDAVYNKNVNKWVEQN